MDGFTKVADLSNVPLGEQICVTFANKKILICHTEAGVFAVENRCTHAKFPLEGGRVEGCVIRCPVHGAKFDLRTGEPKIERLKPVKTYQVKVENGGVFLTSLTCPKPEKTG